MSRLVAGPGLTVTLALILAVSTAAASVAVIVRVPVDLKVKLDSARVPETKLMFPAVAPLSPLMVALASEVVIVPWGGPLGPTHRLGPPAWTATACLVQHRAPRRQRRTA